jgi:hypothetical protein
LIVEGKIPGAEGFLIPSPPVAHGEGFYAQVGRAYPVGTFWPPLYNRR